MTTNMIMECSEQVRTVVCVPTFRRPDHLGKTLLSLVKQEKNPPFATLVVENDAGGKEGAALASSFFKDQRLSGFCVIESAQGHCNAVNKVFSTALTEFPNAEFFLMIDDDEIASPHWLRNMLQAAGTENADIVGGPVISSFKPPPKKAIALHPLFHSHYQKSGPVPYIYGSGNMLVRRKVLERFKDPLFDLGFNFLGGGDMHFFRRCQNEGFKFYWNHEAGVVETVPAERSNYLWIVNRGLRIGVINYTIDRKLGTSAIKAIAKNFLHLPLALGRGFKLLMSSGYVLHASHPLVLAIGRNLAGFGFMPEPYRADGRDEPQ